MGSDEPKQRLDRFLATQLNDLSRSTIQKLIEQESVLVNGESLRASTMVQAGDAVSIEIPAAEISELIPEAIPLNIIYEDACILVLNKPAGLVIHPAAGHDRGTLVNALLHHDSAIACVGGTDRPGIVHRLDKGTSGVMVVAKTEAARLDLVKQFKDRGVDKEYWAIVHGVPSPLEGSFESPLGRHPQHRQKVASIPSGRQAHTDYRVDESFGGLFAAVRLILHTGRTHQIRVHLSEAWHPIIGDKTYGGQRDTRKSVPEAIRAAIKGLGRPALHAARLAIDHPETSERMTFKAPLPKDLTGLSELLKSLP